MAQKLVDGEELAEALSCTSRTVRKLESDGIISREPAGGFDPLKCAVAVLRHRRADFEARAARAENVRHDSMLKALRIQRQLGRLIGADELRDLGAELWGGVWTMWTMLASLLYHSLPVTMSETERRVLTASIDTLAKGELHLLRDAFEQRLRGARAELTDEDRVERLMRKLAGTDDEPVE